MNVDELLDARLNKRFANKSSFLTIFDSNLTTVIAAAVLFFFGESSVKGFATMLLLGILMIFVTAVFLSRGLLSLLVSSNFFKNNTGYLVLRRRIDMILMKVKMYMI